MNKEQLSWGIIGLGNIAHQFIQDLQLLAGHTVVAVASRSRTKARKFASEYGVENYYGDYKSLFKDARVDIVYIATPHNSHAELSIEAMDHNKHVLCEKPLAVNKIEVQQMIAKAQSKNVFLMEAFWTRFNPSLQAILELLEKNTIGEVNYINADFTFYRDDPDDSRMLNIDLAGGSLLDMGVYPVFLAYVILGKPIQLSALARFHKTGVDLQTVSIFQYPSGVANLMSGFTSQSDMVAKIYGTTGRIYIHPIWHESQGFTLIQGNDGQYNSQEFSYPTKGKGFTYEIEECLKCIKNDQIESKIWSHQNSLELIEITDEIRRQTGLIYPFEKISNK